MPVINNYSHVSQFIPLYHCNISNQLIMYQSINQISIKLTVHHTTLSICHICSPLFSVSILSSSNPATPQCWTKCQNNYESRLYLSFSTETKNLPNQIRSTSVITINKTPTKTWSDKYWNLKTSLKPAIIFRRQLCFSLQSFITRLLIF